MVTSNRGSQQLDSQGTPRYATFNSTKVLICGYPEADAAALSKAIEQEGGKVLKKYYKGSRPDVIVCGTVADRNCKVSSCWCTLPRGPAGGWQGKLCWQQQQTTNTCRLTAAAAGGAQGVAGCCPRCHTGLGGGLHKAEGTGDHSCL